MTLANSNEMLKDILYSSPLKSQINIFRGFSWDYGDFCGINQQIYLNKEKNRQNTKIFQKGIIQ